MKPRIDDAAGANDRFPPLPTGFEDEVYPGANSFLYAVARAAIVTFRLSRSMCRELNWFCHHTSFQPTVENHQGRLDELGIIDVAIRDGRSNLLIKFISKRF